MPRPAGRAAANAMAARVAATQELLEAEVARLIKGEDWVRFLGFQARLHRYSSGNTLLIVAQHSAAFHEGRVPDPEPSYVAGYQTWKALGRHVDKGQHGYAILAPVRSVFREAVDVHGERRRLGPGEQLAGGEIAESRQVLRGWTIRTVWDASQTSGRPLPERPQPKLLEGQAPQGLREAVVGLIEARGFSFSTVPDAGSIGGANARTDFSARTVVVRADMDQAAQVRSILHEAGHLLLRHGEPPGCLLPRALQEVEAESVAFVVATANSMPAGPYSFAYIGSWAGEAGPRAVAATQARVAEAAKTIIAISPARHMGGGRPPGAEAALGAPGVGGEPAADPEPEVVAL
ncbi:MAG TPA: ArdC-like ssDNA-binding domain-containing protein [Acidimicrobiales bacterium]|nr:ArdC-like ssDNA-binding domain-containing protein [Acidimicrobiales bacterium]